jgi:hypothetical protein
MLTEQTLFVPSVHDSGVGYSKHTLTLQTEFGLDFRQHLCSIVVSSRT